MRLYGLGLMLATTSALAAPLEPGELPGDVYLDRTGFPELMIQNSILGPFVGGAITESIFDDDEPVRAASGFYLGLGAGIALPIIATHRAPIGAAQAAYINFAERWALINGLIMPGLWNNRERDAAAITLSANLGVGVVGAVLTWPRLELTPGQVSALGTAHLFGVVTSALVLWSFDVVPDSQASFAGPTLFVANAAVAGVFLTRDVFDIDRRRVILMDLGGLGGLLTGTGVAFLIAGGEDWRSKGSIYGSSMLGGMLAGMAFAYAMSSDLDEYRAAAVPSLSLAPVLIPERRGSGRVVGLGIGGAL
jgi:hypothetical protein